jgi:transcriptional regulator with XRE-family HTH domain
VKREIEHRWRELGEFVREQRRLGQLSLRRLSEKSGISNPYLSQIERGQRRPSAEILQQLARALEISAETLYVRAGILEERSGGGSADSVTSAIRAARDLTEDQKRTLIHIYQSFRADAGRGPGERLREPSGTRSRAGAVEAPSAGTAAGDRVGPADGPLDDPLGPMAPAPVALDAVALDPVALDPVARDPAQPHRVGPDSVALDPVGLDASGDAAPASAAEWEASEHAAVRESRQQPGG